VQADEKADAPRVLAETLALVVGPGDLSDGRQSGATAG